MDQGRKVLIIGSGVAGPTLGIALRRAGMEAVIYEAAPAPRDNAGLFLNLAPNGINVLRALGVEHILDGVGFRNDRLVFQNDAGKVLAETAVGAITLLRGDLSRALREAALEAGVRFEFGKALTSVEETVDGVLARFSDGTEAHGTVLIGADGIHSATRRGFFPEAPEPSYTGIINLGGVVRTDLPPTGNAMRMVFGRRGFFGYAVLPSGETYWFSNFAQRQEPERARLNAVDASQYRQQLLALHRDDPPEITRVLNAVTGPIGAYPIYDIPSLPRWHRGRVALIGDAAHAIGPHVGQGASLAMEDAFVLAKCLRDIPGVEAALAAFEQLRRARVERVVKQSRQTGARKAPSGWLGRKVRDLVLPMFLRKAAQGAAWLYSYPLVWDEPVNAAPVGLQPIQGRNAA